MFVTYVSVAFSGDCTVSCFDWHHSNQNRMLTVSSNGQPKDNVIFEKIAVVGLILGSFIQYISRIQATESCYLYLEFHDYLMYVK